MDALLSWFLALDGSVLSALGLWLGLNYIAIAWTGGTRLPYYITRSVLQMGAVKLSNSLLLIMVVIVGIWDMDNPGVQFPLGFRMALTLPALLLSNAGLLPLLFSALRELREQSSRTSAAARRFS